MYYTQEKIAQIFTDASDETIQLFDTTYMHGDTLGLTDQSKEAMYLATILAEVGTALLATRENLNYTPTALRSTFSYYANNPDEADADGRTDDHAANQPNIGNKAYANRLGNGDVESGDGYTYRGGGYIQITGKGNYEDIASAIASRTGLEIAVDELALNSTIPSVANIISLGWWYLNDVYACPDMDCTTDIVNYYTDSRDDRENNYYKIMEM